MTVKKVQRGILYRANGTVKLVIPANGKKFEYPELSQAVGGMIQEIRPTKDKINLETGLIAPGVSFAAGYLPHTAKVTQVWANEEGLIESLPLNPHTRTVADMHCYVDLNGYPAWWRISGDVLVIYNVPTDKLELDSERVTIANAFATAGPVR